MFKRASRLAALALAIAAAGCAGSDGSQGPQGPQGSQGNQGPQGNAGQDLTATAKAESCAVCHQAAGADHQGVYNQYAAGGNLAVVTDSVQTVSSVVTWTFTIKQGGVPVTGLPALIAAVDPATGLAGTKTFYMGLFDPTPANSVVAFSAKPISFGSPVATATPGQYTVTATATTWAPESSIAYVYGYVAWGPLMPANGNVKLYKNIVNFSKTFNGAGTLDAWTSTANVSACENCHGAPYRKHGYRMAVVAGLPTFAACKSCHYDSRDGSDTGWQFLADDPLGYATTASANLNPYPTGIYAYKATVMNDVHMSHAMEFAYPQSMANCSTCHAGKLNVVLAPEKFKIETCKSCHPVTGPAAKYVQAGRAPALTGLMQANTAAHNGWIANLYSNSGATPSCLNCHTGLPGAPSFAEMHTGYDSKIYSATGTRYSNEYQVTIDAASLTTSLLTVSFHATQTGTDPMTVGSITPTVSVALYGYDTKDFIVDPHGSTNGLRNLEWKFGTAAHPRFNVLTAAGGNWTITADLSTWAALIANGSVKRVEIGVLPELKDASGTIIALNAPSKTFDLKANAFVTSAPIVDAAKCNKCHDALGTSFHTGDRGGNVTVCRLCHNTRSAGSHLEMQSRSIDSYAHAIHSFQPFDPVNFDTTDPVVQMRYQHHIESTIPTFTLANCEACHVPGSYNVPNQSKSLPGVISGTKAITYIRSNVGVLPPAVTGPAARACGGCHRAAPLNEDDGAALAAFDGHTGAFGTWLETTSAAAAAVLDAAITKLWALF